MSTEEQKAQADTVKASSPRQAKDKDMRDSLTTWMESQAPLYVTTKNNYRYYGLVVEVTSDSIKLLSSLTYGSQNYREVELAIDHISHLEARSLGGDRSMLEGLFMGDLVDHPFEKDDSTQGS